MSVSPVLDGVVVRDDVIHIFHLLSVHPNTTESSGYALKKNETLLSDWIASRLGNFLHIQNFFYVKPIVWRSPRDWKNRPIPLAIRFHQSSFFSKMTTSSGLNFQEEERARAIFNSSYPIFDSLLSIVCTSNLITSTRSTHYAPTILFREYLNLIFLWNSRGLASAFASAYEEDELTLALTSTCDRTFVNRINEPHLLLPLMHTALPHYSSLGIKNYSNPYMHSPFHYDITLLSARYVTTKACSTHFASTNTRTLMSSLFSTIYISRPWYIYKISYLHFITLSLFTISPFTISLTILVTVYSLNFPKTLIQTSPSLSNTRSELFV